MDTFNYGAPPGQAFQPGYPMNHGGFAQPPVPPAGMNPAMAPAYYPPVNNAGFPSPAQGFPAAAATAPPAEFPGPLPGYESIFGGDNGGKFLPPPPDMGPGPAPVPSSADSSWQVPSISNEDAKDALLEYVNGECCYGTTPVNEMAIQALKPYNTYRYRLETFTEARTCDWTTTPYTGQTLDSPANGPAPLPWQIPVTAPPLFKDETKKTPVPHTSSVKQCPLCNGIGKIVCQKCHGSRGQCSSCNGKGENSEKEKCHRCDGDGKENCSSCNNNNVQTCTTCNGKGQVVSFIELTVTWKNNVSEYIPDHNSDFPIDKFKEVKGDKIFTDEQMMVPPLVNFPEASINQASQNCVQDHRNQYFTTCRVLRQRHSIEWLPLTKVEYTWKEKPYNYFVYGKEKKVYTEKYAQTCCCVIL
ncbi:protein SSUH2 homolog [Spea bombifrons]|uniref:protein SSUH2 homolog n=1 Tax=Spea bombifrons TaxID=233779 RepID=UPI0023496DCB|nr:protein SSUH2 homolog [Spea bombifrons]XP_053324966.1 protein SSUH2 homolog [Spea bombifrons]